MQIAQGARVKPLQPVVTGGYEIMKQDGFSVSPSNIQILIMLTTVAADGGLHLADQQDGARAARSGPASRT